MSVTMICPNLKCGQTVIAPDSVRGKVVRCAHCHQTFMVPKAPEAPRGQGNSGGQPPAEMPAKRKAKQQQQQQ